LREVCEKHDFIITYIDVGSDSDELIAVKQQEVFDKLIKQGNIEKLTESMKEKIK